MLSLHCPSPQPLCICPAWPRLWQSPVSRSPDSSELSSPVSTMCPFPSFLMALCSHLPGLSCGEPLVHNHWISKGLVLWFQYAVTVVCRPLLSAVTNLASVVLGPGALLHSVLLGPAIQFLCHVPAVCHPGTPFSEWLGLH